MHSSEGREKGSEQGGNYTVNRQKVVRFHVASGGESRLDAFLTSGLGGGCGDGGVEH